MNKFSRYGIPIITATIIIMVISFLIYLPIRSGVISDFMGRTTAQQKIRSGDLPENTYPVIKVVDGDTIDVLIDNQKVRVRLLGINSPESVDPRRPVECFGKESKKFLESIIAGQVVKLVTDPAKPNTDEYGRLLRYVYLGNQSVNQTMIDEGYAYEYTYHDEDYLFQDNFKQSEQTARSEEKGLWSTSTCNGEK
jgi:micrococcal nuclease